MTARAMATSSWLAVIIRLNHRCRKRHTSTVSIRHTLPSGCAGGPLLEVTEHASGHVLGRCVLGVVGGGDHAAGHPAPERVERRFAALPADHLVEQDPAQADV